MFLRSCHAAVSALFLVGAAAAAAERPRTALQAGPERSNRVYLVQLVEDPAVAYAGGIAGLAATRPTAGRKIDPDAAHVVRYVAHLAARHDTVLRSVGGGRKLYSYGMASNGFAAELTPAQARRLQRSAAVLRVEKDRTERLATSFTPGFLGLSGSGGVWAQTGATGENIVIGVLDSGIWPEHASVSDSAGAYAPLPTWRGRCVAGEAFVPGMCNQKLIGARFYNAGWGGNAAIDALFPDDFNSPRDYDSHGTHTATTAGGNANVPVTGTLSTAETVGAVVSGIAPRARIAVYKIFWGRQSFRSDVVAAIDQAVADGVDVINYSALGSQTSFTGIVADAFRQASAVGIFVAAAAGNEGPDIAPVGNIAPWLTTVAASTHAREARGLLTLGNGSVLKGRAAPALLPAAPLVDALAAGRPGADPEQLGWCFGAADGAVPLDPAKVAGRIVVCERGGSDRVNKGLAVQQAGGVGMVLVNSIVELAYADLQVLPTVHLFSEDRAALKAYAATPGATAAIRGELVFDAAAPYSAFFSSRGPVAAGGSNLLKPDLAAPGYEVLAGVAPFHGDGVLFYVMSGTSMATPHVAGLGALLRQLHPAWSPMAIKSALMSTATDLLDSTASEAERLFRQGAGQVQPKQALNPGLVFDAGPADWLAFLCSVGESSSPACPAVRADSSDYNGASIAIGALAGSQTVKRQLTNVSGNPASFSASHSGLAGIDVAVSPQPLTLAAGQTGEVTIRFTRRNAALDAHAGGQLRWSDGVHQVRVPLLVRPIALAAPAEVTASYGVRFGYDGGFSASTRGLVPATLTAGSITDDPSDSNCSLTSPNAVLLPLTVPEGTSYLRLALFDADVAPGSDIDLCLYRGSTQVGISAGPTAAETLSLASPAPGTYTVVLNGWQVEGSSPFVLHTWLLGKAVSSNMRVTAPAVARIGEAGAVRIRTSGLLPGRRYLGSVAYGGSAELPAPTIVRVDP